MLADIIRFRRKLLNTIIISINFVLYIYSILCSDDYWRAIVSKDFVARISKYLICQLICISKHWRSKFWKLLLKITEFFHQLIFLFIGGTNFHIWISAMRTSEYRDLIQFSPWSTFENSTRTKKCINRLESYKIV